MAEFVLVCIAWPYANSDIHQGNVTGSHLPGDIFARYHRLRGDHVLMVSGSDSHGTPVTVKAEEVGQSNLEVYEHYHARFLELFRGLGISYDLFTSTHTENHFQVSQDIFTRLLENGYLYRKVTPQMYSPETGTFLPDRYVEGTCPNCGYTGARGDQCDNCNTLFESAAQLINPRSKRDNTSLVLRDTEHFFLDLPAIAEDSLSAWIHDDKEYWRPQVINFARNFIDQGLIGRAVTRDMDWGIPVPVEDGYDDKVLYVWFEAVIGYLSATIEWAKNSGDPDAWREWWYKPAARTFYFIGKDNIPFHTVFWPAQLLGARGLYSDHPDARLNLPYDVPANEFMNMEGRKISGSRHWGVWMLEALDRYDPDPLRYYLTTNMPETRDSDWSWSGFIERNNNELVANWGNLVNRVLNMTRRYFDGVVPEPGDLTAADEALLTTLDAGFATVAEFYDGCKFRAAVGEILRLSTLVNQYLEETSPWTTIKTDPAAAGRALYVALQAINGLKVLWAPVLPFTSQALHEMLGEAGTLFGEQVVRRYDEATHSHMALTYDAGGAAGRWERASIPAGRQLPPPRTLFKKLEPELAEQELAALSRPL
ncbi:MAG: methionine--tRNA ligase [Anaerolineae bacterium]|uniref:methionine--tRNA ligase n=1 Tax=Promineifilum sp. TaxID=2664178 RepID=UPI001DAF1998|nr:methionine--tRNA ligase [Anaerolineales bacterium]MCB8935438.1 methionine--tRNA ligase [Promineifilum sp.]MCO5180491.1 methionine--tRNA ligase [Promineifilum sp.]MCW5847752.1 methionine--tRNA ligase [Anaerolineae bacterium]